MIEQEFKRIIEKKVNDTLDIIQNQTGKDREDAKDVLMNIILHLEN